MTQSLALCNLNLQNKNPDRMSITEIQVLENGILLSNLGRKDASIPEIVRGGTYQIGHLESF